MRRAALILLASVVPAATPTAAGAAQQPQAGGRVGGCVVDFERIGGQLAIRRSEARYEAYASGGVRTRCRGEATVMEADSMAWFSERGELQLHGSVHFRDSVTVLDAERATYWVRQERLLAERQVYARNLATGSDLRGPNLEYLRAAPPLRSDAELIATRRPTIHFSGASEGADTSEPFVLVADRVRMRGEDLMWAAGTVEIDRSDLSARADSAWLDLTQRRGALLVRPEVRGKDGDEDAYRLRGRRIDLWLSADRDLERAVSTGSAVATGTDWSLFADTLDFALAARRLTRAAAWGSVREGERAESLARPYARSEGSTISADSISILMPEQLVETVWAFGRALSTSRPDSAVIAAGSEVEDDWIAGDTLRATFARDDSALARRSRLRHLTAFGTARAFYHVSNRRAGEAPGPAEPPSDAGERGGAAGAAGPPGISYSRGRRIEVSIEAGRVSTVDVVGAVDGVYLEPLPVAADTTGAPSPTTAPVAGRGASRRAP